MDVNASNATTRDLLQQMNRIQCKRNKQLENVSKRKLQSQLNQIGRSTETSRRYFRLEPPKSPLKSICPQRLHTPYQRERNRSFFHMQSRQVDENSVLSSILKPNSKGNPEFQLQSYHSLINEVGAARTRQALQHEMEAAKHQAFTHQVVQDSIKTIKQTQRRLLEAQNDTPRKNSTLQMHLTHEEALERLRIPAIGRSRLEEFQMKRHLLESQSKRHLNDADAFHRVMRISDQERTKRNLSIEILRQGGQDIGHPISLTPNRFHDNSSITSDILHIYSKVIHIMYPDQNHPTHVNGQEIIGIDEFIKMFCLAMNFSSPEWARKCYVPSLPSVHDTKMTLLQFANTISILRKDGSDQDKMKFVFSIYDRDRSGTVEVDEVFQTLQSEKEDLWDQIIFSQQLLGLVNPNHDGKMDFHEFSAACQKIPMFFTCFTGSLPLRLSNHPENVKYRLGLNAIRKMWTCGIKESAVSSGNDNPNVIDSTGFKTIISYFFRLTRSSMIDQSLATRLFQTFAKTSPLYVHFDEFISGMSTLIQGTLEERGRMMHSVLDLDRGGTITKNEIEMILRSRAKILQYQQIKDLHLERNANEIMRALDENGDGDISVEEFMRAVRKSPHILESLQDILFSGCRLDSDFDSDAWKQQSIQNDNGLWDKSLDSVQHPDALIRDFKKIFVTAVNKISATTKMHRRKAHIRLNTTTSPIFTSIIPSRPLG